MVVFGGMFEITKELDDLSVLDLKEQQWEQYQQGSKIASPRKSKAQTATVL